MCSIVFLILISHVDDSMGYQKQCSAWCDRLSGAQSLKDMKQFMGLKYSCPKLSGERAQLDQSTCCIIRIPLSNYSNPVN